MRRGLVANRMSGTAPNMLGMLRWSGSAVPLWLGAVKSNRNLLFETHVALLGIQVDSVATRRERMRRGGASIITTL